MDRLILVGLYRLVRNTIKALTIVKPDTVIRWERTGFRLYWRWKSRHRCGRPAVPLEIRRLIREMSIANPLWERRESMGSFSSSASRSARPASPSIWHGGAGLPRRDGRHSFCNHADGIVAMGLFVVPTILFRLLHGLLIMGRGRRQIEPREERSGGRSQTSLYNGTRTHLSSNKDAPISRAAENAGRIICRPMLGGLHHQCGRM
jgi:hypothetical protein